MAEMIKLGTSAVSSNRLLSVDRSNSSRCRAWQDNAWDIRALSTDFVLYFFFRMRLPLSVCVIIS